MADNIDSLMLVILKELRSEVKELRNELRYFRTHYEEDMADLKTRMSGLEIAMVSVKRELIHGAETDARQQISLDTLARRIDRIEHRLELA